MSSKRSTYLSLIAAGRDSADALAEAGATLRDMTTWRGDPSFSRQEADARAKALPTPAAQPSSPGGGGVALDAPEQERWEAAVLAYRLNGQRVESAEGVNLTWKRFCELCDLPGNDQVWREAQDEFLARTEDRLANEGNVASIKAFLASLGGKRTTSAPSGMDAEAWVRRMTHGDEDHGGSEIQSAHS